MDLTREQIEHCRIELREIKAFLEGHYDQENWDALCNMALRACAEGEAVWVRCDDCEGTGIVDLMNNMDCETCRGTGRVARPAPSGYVLVPREQLDILEHLLNVPEHKRNDAEFLRGTLACISGCYRAMLAAAPASAEGEGE